MLYSLIPNNNLNSSLHSSVGFTRARISGSLVFSPSRTVSSVQWLLEELEHWISSLITWSDTLLFRLMFRQSDCQASESEFVMPVCFVLFTFKVPVAIDLHLINHKGAHFQLKICFTVPLKKKVIFDGLRKIKLTENVNFWVNFLFNTEFLWYV